MPGTYATVTTKKFLDAAGLTYFSRKLNNYPTNEVIAAVIDGIQDALDEKMYVEEYNTYSLFPLEGSDKTLYIDTSVNSIYRWTGSSYHCLNSTSSPATITNAEIDALF